MKLQLQRLPGSSFASANQLDSKSNNIATVVLKYQPAGILHGATVSVPAGFYLRSGQQAKVKKVTGKNMLKFLSWYSRLTPCIGIHDRYFYESVFMTDFPNSLVSIHD